MGRTLDRLVRLVPALRRSIDQVPVRAEQWRQLNDDALRQVGPLWVVLGDSTAQGIGLADVADGYVRRVQRLLEERDGMPWRVVNLSRSGAVIADVLTDQLPLVAALHPDLVTAVVGGNDLRRTPADRLLVDVEALVAALPVGAVVATLPRGLKEATARRANDVLRRSAAARGLPVADLWSHVGPPWRGKYADGLHPNARGTAEWVSALAEALGLPAESAP